MKKKELLGTLKELLAGKISVTEEDLSYAEEVLKKEKSMVSYLRGEMKVERTKTQARDAAGNVLEDAPLVSKLVVCAGEPKAVLVAFEDAGKLLLGWSKRNEEIDLEVDQELLKFVMKIKNLGPVNILTSLENFVKNARLKEREKPFSKQIGRTLAVLRAKNEEIIINEKSATSSLSGLIPHVVFKAIPRFLKRVEKVTGKKPNNVKFKYKA